ncbi:MAG: histidine triad nucleotide-binding protein [Cycloclasticus sp.]|nr:histidine triad nucleotide-binding protein [Cycloclasticus sp.]MBG95560.1 histidine triad nucleotide-binding protein [Cycloclasticus sp.]HAI96942.1 histidine triad nucleotide-binding protein [Methylococcaceae bacterium]
MSDCLFCKMVSGEITPDIVYETETVLAFRDINPQAPTHVLIIPKKHIETLADMAEEDVLLMGEIMLVAKKVAEIEGIAESGYRTVFNCKQDAGQEVYHIHLHLLGGRKMKWPPG